jgi:hypothetical protein
MLLGISFGGFSYKIPPDQNQLGQAVIGPLFAGNLNTYNFIIDALKDF